MKNFILGATFVVIMIAAIGGALVSEESRLAHIAFIERV